MPGRDVFLWGSLGVLAVSCRHVHESAGDGSMSEVHPFRVEESRGCDVQWT